MAGYGPFRFGHNKQRILIAIELDIFHPQHMAGGFALLPQPLLAAAVKSDEARRDGFLQRFRSAFI